VASTGGVAYLQRGGRYAPSLAAPPRHHRRGFRGRRCCHVTGVLAATLTSTRVRHLWHPMALAECVGNGIEGDMWQDEGWLRLGSRGTPCRRRGLGLGAGGAAKVVVTRVADGRRGRGMAPVPSLCLREGWRRNGSVRTKGSGQRRTRRISRCPGVP
jgi:hypothetical protein